MAVAVWSGLNCVTVGPQKGSSEQRNKYILKKTISFEDMSKHQLLI